MITDRIYQWARSDPTKTAVIYNDLPISYSTYARAINAARVFLKEQQIPVGSTAVVLANSLMDTWTFVMALRSLGITTTSVKSIAQAEQLKIGNLSCIVTVSAELDSLELNGTALAETRIVAIPDTIFANVFSGGLPDFLEEIQPFGGHILYTSGTTGTFKKVLLEGSTEDKRNDWWIRNSSFDEKTVFHAHAFSLWTIGGFGFPSSVWLTGGCVVIDQQENAIGQLFRYSITNAFMTPDLVKSVIQSCNSPWPRNAEISVGGGFLPLALARETINRITNRLKIVYSSTECVAVLHSYFETDDDLYWLTPLPERIVQVVDELDSECLDGQEGLLRILLKDVDASGYLDDEETSATFFRNGFFYPGDMAVRREDGRIRRLGRSVDVLNVQGLKVAVAALEEDIQRHLQVEAVCLFSGLSASGRNELVIAIQANREIQAHELNNIFKLDMIAPLAKGFDEIRYSIMKEFPRTESGMSKFRRSDLRKQLFAENRSTVE